MATQVTFRAEDLLNLIGSEIDKQILIEIDEENEDPALRRRARIRPDQSRAENDPPEDPEEVIWINGCPFPPGCTP